MTTGVISIQIPVKFGKDMSTLFLNKVVDKSKTTIIQQIRGYYSGLPGAMLLIIKKVSR